MEEVEAMTEGERTRIATYNDGQDTILRVNSNIWHYNRNIMNALPESERCLESVYLESVDHMMRQHLRDDYRKRREKRQAREYDAFRKMMNKDKFALPPHGITAELHRHYDR